MNGNIIGARIALMKKINCMKKTISCIDIG